MNLAVTAKRRANFILTSLNLRHKGFFTPYDYLRDAQWDVEPYPHILADFQSKTQNFMAFLACIADNEPYFAAMAADKTGPSWTSGFLSRLDAAAIYTGITHFKPARIIEIGSGNSTHFMARAISDHALDTKLTCIDPKPRVTLENLPVTFINHVLMPSHIDLFSRLEPDDVVFIDSSHIVQQGMDVDILFNRIFPILKSGVIVHLHDIFLPYGYPDHWEPYRFNEQLALMGWLTSGYFETLFPSHFVWRNLRDALRAICPGFCLDTPENGGTLWLRKR